MAKEEREKEKTFREEYQKVQRRVRYVFEARKMRGGKLSGDGGSEAKSKSKKQERKYDSHIEVKIF